MLSRVKSLRATRSALPLTQSSRAARFALPLVPRMSVPVRHEHQPAHKPLWMWDFERPHLKGYAEDPKIPSDPIHPEPNLVKDILKGLALGLTLGFLWKIYHWNLQKKIAGYYDKQESK